LKKKSSTRKPPNSAPLDATIRQIVKYDIDGHEVSRKVDYFEYNGHKVELGTIGNILGSQLGAVLGGNSLVGKVAASTVIGTLTQSLGKVLQKTWDLSGTVVFDGTAFEQAWESTLNHFGQDLVVNLEGQVLGQISSLLMTELADALDLDGFEGKVFTAVGNTITNQILTNVWTMVKSPNPDPSMLFQGFDPKSLFGNVAGAVGGFLGTYLASQIIVADNTQASYGTSMGSSVGAYVGSLLIPIPGLGSLIGAFVGDILGTVIGNAVGVDEKSWGSVSIDLPKGIAVAGGYGSSNEGLDTTFVPITSSQASTVNRIVSLTGAHIIGLNGSGSGRIDYWQKGKTYEVTLPNGTRYDFISRLTGDVDAAWAAVGDRGVMALLGNVVLSGGGVFEMKAFRKSKATNVATLLTDLEVAKSYYKYVSHTGKINVLIAEASTTAFAQAWTVTLARAKELGLDTIRKLDHKGDDGKTVFKGTSLIDNEWGYGGDDKLSGQSKNDVLRGGDGNDRLDGGDDDDRLYGEADRDKLYGGNGNDTLDGGAGDDLLWG
jgi:hypothetical protein